MPEEPPLRPDEDPDLATPSFVGSLLLHVADELLMLVDAAVCRRELGLKPIATAVRPPAADCQTPVCWGIKPSQKRVNE